MKWNTETKRFEPDERRKPVSLNFYFSEPPNNLSEKLNQ